MTNTTLDKLSFIKVDDMGDTIKGWGGWGGG